MPKVIGLRALLAGVVLRGSAWAEAVPEGIGRG